jgi:hypothetical protein
MRWNQAILALGALLLITAGCDWIEKIKGNSRPTYDMPAEKPTAPQLISYLNRSAEKLNTLQVSELAIEASRGSGPGLFGVEIDGKLVCQQPRNFRLEAFTPASRGLEADIGSNDREFWFYVKQNDPPYLFHCSHSELNHAALPFPFHPDWIMEALGMAVIPSAENFDVRMDPRGYTVELIERTRSPQGQPVSKITVFNRRTVSGSEPQVLERRIVDARGKDIFRAEIKEMQYDRQTGVVIPYKVVLYSEKARLTLMLNSATVNAPLDRGIVQAKFERPNYPGVQSYDLARRGGEPFRPSSDVRPAGGVFRGSRR